LTGVTFLAIRASRKTASLTAGIGFLAARRGTPTVRLVDSSSHLPATNHTSYNNSVWYYILNQGSSGYRLAGRDGFLGHTETVPWRWRVSSSDQEMFQMAGAAMWKPHLSSSVTVLLTARSPQCTVRRPTRPLRESSLVHRRAESMPNRCLGHS